MRGRNEAASEDTPWPSTATVSSDGGQKWTKLGPAAPFKPNGMTYSDKGKCFYAWRLADNLKRPPQSIVRLLPGLRCG